MTANPTRCPTCQGGTSDIRVGASAEFSEDIYDGTCRTCGRIRITQEALGEVGTERHLLSAFFRRMTPNRPELITTRDIASIIRDLPRYNPIEKRNLLLQYVGEKSSRIGGTSDFDAAVDYPVLFARDQPEAVFYLRSLLSEGFLELIDGRPVVTIKGWDRILQLRDTGKTSVRAFIAMSFDPALEATYEQAIVPAIENAGYQAIRVDRTEHVNRIDDEIIARIRDSRFVIADFTQHRAGVYFEAGYALGLSRNVIWICSRDDLQQLHFDTRQYNMIDYSSVDELKKRLTNRILAIEGRGPLSS